MNAILPKISPLKTVVLTKILSLFIFVSICLLSIKATYDLTLEFDVFPLWFVPSFGCNFELIALSLYLILQMWKITDHSQLLSGKQSIFLWLFMLLSFICTTSVHGFYPFRSNVLLGLPFVDQVMKTNYIIAFFGITASAVLAVIYIFSNLKTPAVIGLLLMSLVMLIPNDNCYNPFNYWWIHTIGASPLMYTPNLYAILFVTCGLHGIRPKGAIFDILHLLCQPYAWYWSPAWSNLVAVTDIKK